MKFQLCADFFGVGSLKGTDMRVDQHGHGSYRSEGLSGGFLVAF